MISTPFAKRSCVAVGLEVLNSSAPTVSPTGFGSACLMDEDGLSRRNETVPDICPLPEFAPVACNFNRHLPDCQVFDPDQRPGAIESAGPKRGCNAFARRRLRSCQGP